MELSQEYNIYLGKKCGNYLGWKMYIKKSVYNKEMRDWRTNMKKSSCSRVLKYKNKPKWEGYLNGNEGGRALFKLRAGDCDRRKQWDQLSNKLYRLCSKEVESISHLLTECELIWKPEVVKRGPGGGKRE